MNMHQGTSVEVRHTNIPDEDYEDIAEGWIHSYMASLQEFYEDEPARVTGFLFLVSCDWLIVL
jgi:hypothetical protein